MGKFIAIVAIILIACLVSGFVIYRMITNIGYTNEQLKDFSFETVTDEDVVEKTIAKLYGSYSKRSGKDSGAHLMGYQDVDRDRCTLSAAKAEGFYVASASKVVDAKLVLNISSEIHAGKGKIAIIQDDKILEYIDFGTPVTREYDVVGESLILVKIVCEDAKIDLTVTREFSQLA